jgi:hypothetical protein
MARRDPGVPAGRRAAVAVLVLLALGPAPAAGQRLDDTARQKTGPAGAAARSLALPGLGQHALGQGRAWLYLAAEAALWAYWGNRRSEAADARAGYRDLAWSEARLAAGVRQDGDWPYYETLTKWTTSGAYDRDPGRSGLQPEEDPGTFNGSVWQLATGFFLPSGAEIDESDPRYAQALAFYEERAYSGAFLWDWSGKDPALGRYKELIRRSDDRLRQATNALGGVLANHLLSATDAWLSARTSADLRLRVLPGPDGGAGGWTLAVRLGGDR